MNQHGPVPDPDLDPAGMVFEYDSITIGTVPTITF